MQVLLTSSKAELAKLINISPERISQYIASGQIGGDTLKGSGRRTCIIAKKAKRHLNNRLDVSPRVGQLLMRYSRAKQRAAWRG